jgi:hypothetical protein
VRQDDPRVPLLAHVALAVLAPVTWEAPAACPEASAVERQIDELLRGSTASRSPLRAEGRVEPDGGGWRLQVVLRDDPRGLVERRELEAAECASLAHAFALIVAVRVDALRADFNVVELQRPRAPPLAAITAEAPRSAPPVADAPRPLPRRASPLTGPRSVPVSAPKPAIGGLLRLEGGVETGMLPGIGGGAGFMGGITGRSWRVELGAGGWPARSAATGTLGTRLDLIVGRARVCWAPAVARWRVPLCGGGEVGGLRGIGTTGVARPSAQWAPWGAATASLGAAWAFRPWIGPYVAVEGVAAFTRPRFSVGDQLVVQTQAVGIRGWIGLELKFASRSSRRAETRRRPAEP